MKPVFCVIMAGGVGSRFWPLSKSNKPKQFLDILGVGKTLLQMTYERLKAVCPDQNFYIVTNKLYKELVLEQLPFLNESQVLLEPTRRNTAPCIAYANYVIKKRVADANIIVTPSDQLILNQDEYLRILHNGLSFVSDNDVLLTLGIKPSRPDTGYGYIQKLTISNDNDSKKNQKETNVNLSNGEIQKVKMFTEKPNVELAKFFCDSGEFFWNSGLFIWRLKSIESAFEQHLNEVYSLFNNSCRDELDEHTFIEKTYSSCPNVSIDYGVMEKASNVYVHEADFGWSDLGTWVSLFENSHKDDCNNVVIASNALLYDTKNCLVNVPNDKIIVLQGLDNYIVVDSGESLLICNKDEEQRIRLFVADIQSKKGDKYV